MKITKKLYKIIKFDDKAQFKVKLNDKGILELVDKDKVDVKNLNDSERNLFNAITDTQNHAVLDIQGARDDVDFGGFAGNGMIIIDSSDMSLLREASSIAAGEAISHEMVEAYKSAKGDCKDYKSCHKEASKSFPEPKGSENSLDKIKDNPIVLSYSEKVTFTKVKISVTVTYQITTPVPKNSVSGQTLANITKIELVKK